MRAQYRIVHQDARVLAIVDTGDGTHASVTNAAEEVVLELSQNEKVGGLPAGRRLVYRDSEERWDELLHDGAGNFLGFGFLDGTSLDDALYLTRERAA